MTACCLGACLLTLLRWCLRINWWWWWCCCAGRFAGWLPCVDCSAAGPAALLASCPPIYAIAPHLTPPFSSPHRAPASDQPHDCAAPHIPVLHRLPRLPQASLHCEERAARRRQRGQRRCVWPVDGAGLWGGCVPVEVRRACCTATAARAMQGDATPFLDALLALQQLHPCCSCPFFPASPGPNPILPPVAGLDHYDLHWAAGQRGDQALAPHNSTDLLVGGNATVRGCLGAPAGGGGRRWMLVVEGVAWWMDRWVPYSGGRLRQGGE